MLRTGPAPRRRRPTVLLPVDKPAVVDIGKIRARLDAGYSDDEARDDHGRWTGNGSGVPLSKVTHLEDGWISSTGKFYANGSGFFHSAAAERDQLVPPPKKYMRASNTDVLNQGHTRVFITDVRSYLEGKAGDKNVLAQMRKAVGLMPSGWTTLEFVNSQGRTVDSIDFDNPELAKTWLQSKRDLAAGAKKCPRCGSSTYGLMPTDFETAKCTDCGKLWEIGAGGPGSGRHADYGNMHKLLIKRGYELHRSEHERQSYIHPDSRVHIQVNPQTGGWRRAEYPDHEGGHGATTLHDYLRGHNHKVAAGGPGSGRHAELWKIHDTLKDSPLRMVNNPSAMAFDRHLNQLEKLYSGLSKVTKGDEYKETFESARSQLKQAADTRDPWRLDVALSHLHGVLSHVTYRDRKLAAGGPGSGCKGENCGRPSTAVRSAQPKQMQFIHDYLDMVAPHSAKGAFIKAHGKEFTSIASKSPVKGKMKECYMNAYQLATHRDGYTYVEGMATTEKVPIPLDHAWCVDAHGDVVDPTWNEGNAYFGVPFKTEYIEKTALKTKVYGVLSHTNLDLLRGKDKVEDIKAGGPGSGCHGDNCGRPASAIPTEVDKILPQYENKDPKSLLVFRVQKAGSVGLVGKNAADLVGVVQFLNSAYYENHGGGDAIGVYRIANPDGKLGTYEGLQNGRRLKITPNPSSLLKQDMDWVPPSSGIGATQGTIAWGIDTHTSNSYSFGPGNYTATKIAEVPISTLSSDDELKSILEIHDVLKEKGITAAFNENEPRDEHGKWTNGATAGFTSEQLKNFNAIPKADYHLSPKDRAIETRFRAKIAADPKRAMLEYRAQFGNELNADKAKELSDDYAKDRTKASAVHEPASWLVKQLFAEDLADPTKRSVFFTAGGAGAGKTTAINQGSGTTFSKKDIVYDGTLRPASSAEKKIQQALDAGKIVAVWYVHRGVEDAFVDGVLPRAMKPESQGGGRTVRIDEIAKQYTSVLDSMKTLQAKFGSNPNFELSVVDNSRGAGRAIVSSLDKLTPEIRTPTAVTMALKQRLDEAYKNGTVSRKIYKATLGPYTGTEEIGM